MPAQPSHNTASSPTNSPTDPPPCTIRLAPQNPYHIRPETRASPLKPSSRFTFHVSGSAFQHGRHQRRPPRLVAGPESGPRIPVEVLVEEEVVAPVRIVVEQRLISEHRTPAISRLIPQEQ